MRAYSVEDLSKENMDILVQALKDKGFSGPMDDFFFLPLPEELYTETQREHAGECGPYVFGLEVNHRIDGHDLKMELLARAKGKLRCSCIAYATPAQRNHMIDFLDGFIRDLDIPV